ncbi:MAG: GHKL domain-containing protein [Nitrospirae bacterium]|nr:GHKL domain-containing protein [Nitrospirota bacterium]
MKDINKTKEQLITELAALRRQNAELKKAGSEHQQEKESDQQALLEIEKRYERLLSAESRLIQDEKMASLGVLSAGVAHEIKNPLAIILQGIELLEISLLKEDVGDVLAMMKDAVFRASKITKDLLTFSRESAPALEEIDLAMVIDETLSFVDHIFSLKQIRIARDFSHGLPMVKVDPNQMKQVFINLLTNAAEAMPEGGAITIAAESAKNIHNRKIVRIVITDTGHGISDEDKQRIFDPFYTTRKKSGGTGLGLSVVKGIIQKHKGDIKIENKPGGGTGVIIELPCHVNEIKEGVAE